MRIIRAVMAVGLGVAVCACTTAEPQPGGGGSDIVADATTQARKLCRFVPTAETILALFATGQVELSAAVGIANAICKAIAPVPGTQNAPGTVAVAGVPIRGEFER